MQKLIHSSKSKVISLNKLNKSILMDLNNGNGAAHIGDYQLDSELENLKAQKHLL